jgi:hypothetical protein
MMRMRCISIVANASRPYRSLPLPWSRSKWRTPHVQLAQCCVPSSQQQSGQQDDDAVLQQILYQRNTDRNTIPRAAFGASVFNTVYWLWYSLDFIPAVNASPIEDLHIDPAMGFGGLALGLMINSVTFLYPMSLISKLAYSPSTQTWHLWKHELPLIRPSTTPVSYSLGDLKMDPSSSETKNILDGLNGNLTKYRGHLGISAEDKNIPFLLEIREPTEVMDSDLLLQALLNPQAMKREAAQTKQPRRGGKKGKRGRR